MDIFRGVLAADIAVQLELFSKSKKRMERLAGDAKEQEGALLEGLAYRKRQFSNAIEMVTA